MIGDLGGMRMGENGRVHEEDSGEMEGIVM